MKEPRAIFTLIQNMAIVLLPMLAVKKFVESMNEKDSKNEKENSR